MALKKECQGVIKKMDFGKISVEPITDDQRIEMTKRVFAHTEQQDFSDYVDKALQHKDVVGNELNVRLHLDLPYSKVKNFAYVYTKTHRNNKYMPLVKADKENEEKCYLLFRENSE